MNFTLKLLWLGIIALWSCGNESKTTTEKTEIKQEEIKKDSCEDVLTNIEKKAFLKDISIFKLDSLNIFDKKYEELFTAKRSLNFTEYKCLGLEGKIWKDFQYENYNKSNKRIYNNLDTLPALKEATNIKMNIYNYGKINNIPYFTNIRAAGEGATEILLFTISPKTKRVVDVIEVAYSFGDMGYIIETKGKIINDSIITILNEHTYMKLINKTDAVRDTSLKEASKFLITKTGEIKLLEHKVLINKEMK